MRGGALRRRLSVLLERVDRRPRWRRVRGAVASATFLVGAVWFMASNLGEEGGRELGQRLLNAHPGYLALAACINLARYGAWALRWQWLMAPVVRTRWLAAFRALMVSVFLNTVVPAARPLGGLIRARLLSRSAPGPSGPIYGGTLVDQFGYSIVSALVGAACLPWAFAGDGRGGRGGPVAWTVGLLGLATITALIHPGLRGRLAAWMRRRLPAAAGTVQGALAASRTLLGKGRTFALMAAGGTVVWFANAVVLWIAGWAVGTRFSLGAAASAWALGSLAGAVTGTPGGAGTTEGAAILPLMAQGIPKSEALAAVLLARGLHYISAILLGGACFLLRPRAAPPP